MVQLGVFITLLSCFSGISTGIRVGRQSRSSCGLKRGEKKPSIVNGDEASECEWKWQVGLWLDGEEGPYCGGTLIAPEWVLTAAHCILGEPFKVKAGDHKVNVHSSNEQTVEMAEVFVHPEYDYNDNRYDIAMVRLAQSFDMTDCVGLACLPEEDLKPDQGNCWITGWGKLRSGGREPNILQEAQVEIFPNDYCWKSKGYEEWQVHESMICAQGREDGKTIDACQGDSGGPLVCESDGKWTLYGATSWGEGCAQRRYPGFYARVHSVMDWIEDRMAGVPQPEKPEEPEEPEEPNFVCDDGCVIPDGFAEDGLCDCSNCEDETSRTCDDCEAGCPQQCGDYC